MRQRRLNSEFMQLAAKSVLRSATNARRWSCATHTVVCFGLTQDIRQLHITRAWLSEAWKPCKSDESILKSRTRTPLQCFRIFNLSGSKLNEGAGPIVRKHFDILKKSWKTSDGNDLGTNREGCSASEGVNKPNANVWSSATYDMRNLDGYAIDPITLRKIVKPTTVLRKSIKVPTSEIQSDTVPVDNESTIATSPAAQKPVDSVRFPRSGTSFNKEQIQIDTELLTNHAKNGVFKPAEPVDSIQAKSVSPDKLKADFSSKSNQKSKEHKAPVWAKFSSRRQAQASVSFSSSPSFSEIEVIDNAPIREEDSLDAESLMKGLNVTKNYSDKAPKLEKFVEKLYADEPVSVTKDNASKVSSAWRHPQFTSYDNILPEDVRRMYQRKQPASKENNHPVDTTLLTDVMKYAKEHGKKQEEDLFKARNAYDYSKEQRTNNARSMERKNFFTSKPRRTLDLINRNGRTQYLVLLPTLKYKNISKQAEPYTELHSAEDINEAVINTTLSHKLAHKIATLQNHGWSCIGRDQDGNLVFRRVVSMVRILFRRFCKSLVLGLAGFIIVTLIMLADSSMVMI